MNEIKNLKEYSYSTMSSRIVVFHEHVPNFKFLIYRPIFTKDRELWDGPYRPEWQDFMEKYIQMFREKNPDWTPSCTSLIYQIEEFKIEVVNYKVTFGNHGMMVKTDGWKFLETTDD